MINVNIEKVVKNLMKDVRFWQPLYEAVVNSLEAGASEIDVVLDEGVSTDPSIPGLIQGFSVKDNGEGFTKKNFDAFCTLWTDNKIKLGCKGSGRFSWLCVFQDIHVRSEIPVEGTVYDFDFNFGFDRASVAPEPLPENSDVSSTTISFRNIKEDYLGSRKEAIRRADVRAIKAEMLEHLLIKLFLLKKKGRPFEIRLRSAREYDSIGWNDIPDLSEEDFSVKSGLLTERFTFYFGISPDSKKPGVHIFYCAGERAVKSEKPSNLGIMQDLPGEREFFGLVCSSFFDQEVDDSRSSFAISDEKESSKGTITFPMIRAELSKKIGEILKKEVPDIEESNGKAITDAVIEAPHLAGFIKENDAIVKEPRKLVEAAEEAFKEKKNEVKKRYVSILGEKQIESKDFEIAVNEMSEIAAIELGEYILYRNQVIDGFQKSIGDKSLKEERFHTILFPKGREDRGENGHEWLLNNIWLLDDKFMTYSYCASDVRFSRIVPSLMAPESFESQDGLKRPDLFFAFEKPDGTRDAVIVELKRPSTDEYEKAKSINEVSRNIGIIREKVPEIRTVWAYIITTIDEQFKKNLHYNETLKPLFEEGEEDKLYYGYFSKVNAHVFVIDMDLVAKDAKRRNERFLEMIKGNIQK